MSNLTIYYQLLATFNEIAPKLYAFSMMWSLNARNELRSIPWGNRSTLSYIDPDSQLGARGPVETVCICRSFIKLHLILSRRFVWKNQNLVSWVITFKLMQSFILMLVFFQSFLLYFTES